MTFEPSDPIELTPTTTRVGSGRSARLVAVAIMGVLVSVVGFAFVNRTPARPSVVDVAVSVATASPEPPATPLPMPSVPRHRIMGNDGILDWAVVSQLPFIRPRSVSAEPPSYTHTVTTSITGGEIRSVLEQDLADVYSGSVIINSADVGRNLVIRLGREWTHDGSTIFESFGSWEVKLKPLRKSRGGLVRVLVHHVPPDLTPDSSWPIAGGYTLTIMGRRDGSQLKLSLELVWPATAQVALAP